MRSSRVIINLKSFPGISVILWVIFWLISFSAFAQAPNVSYSTPQTYKLNNSITPLQPVNTGGPIPVATNGEVTTVATTPGVTGGVAVDAANGLLYVSDQTYNKIYKVNLATGSSAVFAGTGAAGSTDGPGNVATFNQPGALLRDASGNIYVSDQGGNIIRKITPGGVVSTLAGNGIAGYADGPGASASFKNPCGLTIDVAGNVYVADKGNDCIRKITPAGVVTTVASGIAAPTGVDIDAGGNLYVSEQATGKIKKVYANGTIGVVAFGLGAICELRVDASGYIFISDQSSNAVIKFSPTIGINTTLEGAITGPIGLAIDGLGNIYVTTGDNRVLKISIGGYTIDKALPTGLTFDSKTGIISGTPTETSPLTDYGITGYNAVGVSYTTVNLEVIDDGLQPSIITMPPFNINNVAGNLLDPGATSTNKQTPITYTSSDPSIATITADGKIAIHNGGTVKITANQAGNAIYSPAQPVSGTLTITIGQKLNFPTLADKTPCSTDFALNVTSEGPGYGIPLSDIPITYASSDPSVATVSTKGMVHILKGGTTQITANQAAGGFYTAAAPVTQVLHIVTDEVPLLDAVSTPGNICEGAAITFTANVHNLANLTNPSYQWQVNNHNVGTNNYQYISVVNNRDVVKCIVTNNTSCPVSSSMATQPIAVTPYTNLAVSVSQTPGGPVCQGSSIKFVARATNGITGVNYQWQVNGINLGTNDSTYTANNFNDGDKITCTTTDAVSRFCATPSTSSPIIVNILPQVNINASVMIQASGNNVYAGTALTFTAVVANMSGTINYQWQVNGNNAGDNSHSFITSTLNNGDIVTCTASSSTQCSVPATSNPITETILPPLQIVAPNTFTPNGDGINDLWAIAGLNTYPNCTITIYNRYGVQLYFSKGYTKPWDGTDNGKALPVGTYYYVIDLNQHKPKVTGFVTIVR